MLKECLGVSKQTCVAPNEYSLVALFINFYLHPENENRLEFNAVILKIKE